MTTIVYRYALHAPHEGADLVHEQMRLAHDYRNELVAIERARRAALRAVDASVGDVASAMSLVESTEQIAIDCARELKAWRAKMRSKKAPAELTDRVRRARENARVAKDSLREILSQIRERPEIKAEYERINGAPKSPRGEAGGLNGRLTRGARAIASSRGLYPGTYLLVEAECFAAFAMPLYRFGAPNDPRFARWDGSGRVGIHNSPYETLDELASNTRARLSLPDPRAHQLRPDGTADRAARRKYGSTAELALRVGSDDDRAPIWARWVLDMHRPLPEGAEIGDVAVVREMRGPHSRWYALITLRVPESVPTPARVAKRVAINFGWRTIGNELRVASCFDGERAFELRLPPKTIRMLTQPDVTRGERDDRYNAIRARLRTWIVEHESSVPEWLREETKHMMQWRSPAKLSRVHRLWIDRRFAGDGDIFGAVESWWWADRHLWSVETEDRAQGQASRLDRYRVFAAQLAHDYDEIAFGSLDLQRFARRKPVGDDEARDVNRYPMRLASVDALRLAIKQAAAKRGRTVIEIDAAYTTRACPACGVIDERRDTATSHLVTCECGHEWDQDLAGAAPAIYRRACESEGASKILVGAREDNEAKSGNKWDRRKEKAAKAQAEKQTAREAAGNEAK